MAISKASVLLVFMFATETWSLTFFEVPQPTGVLLGNTAQLNCNLQCIQGDACTGLIWSERVSSAGGSEIDIYYSDTGSFNNGNPNRNRYSIVPGTTNLLIKSVNSNDAGRYSCRPNRGGSSNDTKFAYLTVFEKSTCQSNGVAVENGQASVSCHVKFHKSSDVTQKPDLSWNKTGQTGGKNDNEVTMMANFTVISGNNGGSHTCRTFYSPTPPTYTDSCTTTINVHFGPRNINITTKAAAGLSSVRPGEKLICYAEGNPAPTYTWHKVSGPAGSSSVLLGQELEATAAMEGVNTYRCEARNTLVNSVSMMVSQNVTITVFVPTTTTTTTTTPSTPVPVTTPTELIVTSSNGKTINPGPSTQETNVAAIVGGCVAAAVVIIIIIVVIIFIKRRRGGSPAINRDEEKQPGPPQTNPTMHHPDVIRPANQQGTPYDMNDDDPRMRNVENLQYADLALDDTPRSRKPIQVYDLATDTQYAEIQHGKSPAPY